MGRRLFDVTLAALGLVLLAPLFIVAAAGIHVSSPGPLLYRARRVGCRGREFTLFKFRTMHPGADALGGITAARDSRVFGFGDWLRRSKIDELPQLLNILNGDMSIIGPRPEDPEIV